MRRRIAKLAIFLLLGAIINVAVAWGCAIWSPLGDQTDLSYDEWRLHIQTHGESASNCRLFYAYRSEGIGLSSIVHGELCGERRKMFVTPSFGMLGPFEYSAGLPLKCLDGTWSMDGAIHSLNVPPSLGPAEVSSFFRGRVFPVRPLWPGFAINTIFYAALAWALFAVPSMIKRGRRIKRGVCVRCAYPVGVTSAVCSECGTPVVRRDAAHGAAAGGACNPR